MLWMASHLSSPRPLFLFKAYLGLSARLCARRQAVRDRAKSLFLGRREWEEGGCSHLQQPWLQWAAGSAQSKSSGRLFTEESLKQRLKGDFGNKPWRVLNGPLGWVQAELSHRHPAYVPTFMLFLLTPGSWCHLLSTRLPTLILSSFPQPSSPPSLCFCTFSAVGVPCILLHRVSFCYFLSHIF